MKRKQLFKTISELGYQESELTKSEQKTYRESQEINRLNYRVGNIERATTSKWTILVYILLIAISVFLYINDYNKILLIFLSISAVLFIIFLFLLARGTPSEKDIANRLKNFQEEYQDFYHNLGKRK